MLTMYLPSVAFEVVVPPDLYPTRRAFAVGPPAMADPPVAVEGVLSFVFFSAPGRFTANPLRPNANVRSTFRR